MCPQQLPTHSVLASCHFSAGQDVVPAESPPERDFDLGHSHLREQGDKCESEKAHMGVCVHMNSHAWLEKEND